jgi:hypothetical protein
MKFLNVISNEIEEVSVPDYYNSLRKTTFVRIPKAYGIPIAMKDLVDLLHSHGFISYNVDGKELYKIQEYLILSCDDDLAKGNPRPPKNIKLITLQDERSLDNYEIFPIDQEGGHSLLLLIEPQSKYGFSRYDDLGLKVKPGIQFPVLRITDDRIQEYLR